MREDPAPSVPTHALKGQGISSDACNHLINFCAELIAEAFAPCFVPAPDLKRLHLPLGVGNNIAGHPWPKSFRRTSDQGTAEPGLAKLRLELDSMAVTAR